MPEKPANTGKRKKSRYPGKNPIDPKPLTRMFGNDPDLFKEILNEFINPTNKIITEIKTAWKKRSAKDVELAAHKLKSSALSVGAIELGNICSMLEIAGHNADWVTIDEQATRLEPVMNKVEQYIKTL